MDEKIVKEFDSLEASLNKKIQSKVPITSGNYCYLIKENWFNKISQLIYYKKNDKLDKSKDNNIILNLNNEQPEFIDDISSILDCLENKIKIKFMSIKLLELIYDIKILKNHHQVSFYSGNNRIIIEYKEKQDNALFIINPLENISKVILISTLNNINIINDKNHLYKVLLKKEKLNFDKIYRKYYKILANFKDFSNICLNQIIEENIQSENDNKIMDSRYKKDIKKNLNRSVDYNQKDSSKYNETEKNLLNRAYQNNNVNNKNDEIKQLKLKIKDLKEKIEEKIKIIKKLEIEKNDFYSKYHEYKDKIKKIESNLKSIIKFNNDKLIIIENINFELLSNKNEENKKKGYSEKTDNKGIKEIEKLSNEEIEKMKKKIKKTKKELEKLKNENKAIGDELIIIKKENNKLKEQNIELINKNNEEVEKLKNENKTNSEEFNRIKEENNKLNKQNEKLNLESIKFIKLAPNTKKKAHNRSSSVPKNESQFYNEPIKLYDFPTLIGLNNIGATCFMNSTLQCLSQTEALTNYFLKERNWNRIMNNNLAKNNENPQLSPIFLELIKKLWSKEKMISFSPNKFMDTIEKMNPLFKTGQAGDAKDFIIFILEQIHKELKQPIKTYYNNNNINFIQPLNQYDKNNVFNNFMNDFRKECSIISDIFFGFNETTNICVNCKNIYNSKGLYNPICYNYGIFNCLIFPLEEVKNMRNNQMNNNNNSNYVSLYDCFCYNKKSEFFTGENRNYCNICKQKFDSIYTSQIFVSPNILIIILNRGRGNIFDVKLNFTESINITQFVLQKDKPQIIYNLYGVITHIGQSGPNAHFIASCKSPVDYRWYRFNDSIVNPINNFQKEVIEFGTPYILFYQKQN